MSASEFTVRATAIAWRWPPDSRATGTSMRGTLTPISSSAWRVSRSHRAVGQQRQRPVEALALEEHVLVDGELVDQREVLVDAVDPQRARVVDRAQLGLLAVDDQASGVGLLEAAR